VPDALVAHARAWFASEGGVKVVGIELDTASARVVLVDGDKVTFTVPSSEEWQLASNDRPGDYVEIRKRLVERISGWQPDMVCIEPLEPFALKRRIKMALVSTAELRGVLAEAVRSTGALVSFPFKASVNADIGTRDATAYVKDNAKWSHLGPDFKKKFRPAVVLALSHIRST
jgi:hypothetical protein